MDSVIEPDAVIEPEITELPTIDDYREIVAGVDGIVEALVMIQDEYHVGLTCYEADGFYLALRKMGLEHAAECFMESHAAGDDLDEGDLHETITDNEGRVTGWKYRDEEDDDDAPTDG